MSSGPQKTDKPAPPGSGIWPKGPVSFMAQNGVAANILMIAILMAGLFAYRAIPQEVFAENSLDTISISVSYPGATPSEIEDSIVLKIEEAVAAVEGIKEVTSTASENVGTVRVELEEGTSMSIALDDVKAEIDQIQTFPDEAEEPSIRELTSRQSVLGIALFGDAPEASLKELAYRLEDELAVLPDVSYVETSSVRDYEITINVPQDTLESLDLSLGDISQAVRLDSLDLPAGSIETNRESVRIRTVGQNYNQSDFEDIILTARSDGTIVRLRDIATITDGFEESELIARFNGKPVAFVDVYRTSDERVLDVASAVKDYMATDFTPSLPQGIDYAIWDDDSLLLQDRLGLLIDNAIIGLILVLISLTLFLNIRLALWTAAGIGVVFVGAIAVLDVAGSSINMFSLFGFILALGLVVDDAVVVGENIYAEREAGRSAQGAAIHGARRVVMPVCFAVATTVAAFSPLLAVGGVIGDILSDIPIVVVAVLLLSVIECLYVLPSHLSHLPKPGSETQNIVTRQFDRAQRWVDARFKAFIDGPLERALRFTTRQPLIILASLTASLIIVFAMLPAGIIKFSFFPEIEGDSVVASLELPEGAPIERTAEITARLEAAAKQVRQQIMDR
ncbi:MAG: efflux RND transporter permease subunit, partial [Pseudomonadota bacterium]